MKFYAHTVEDAEGIKIPESSGLWQPLSVHLNNVSHISGIFGRAFGIEEEAAYGGLLHDLGKYREQFQTYLRGERPSSGETQHAIYGAAWAANEDTPQLFATKLAIAGHHAGLHDHPEIEGILNRLGIQMPEPVSNLIKQLENERGPLPSPPQPPIWVMDAVAAENPFPAEFYARLIFSCIVDADRLDTAFWPNEPPIETPLDAESLLNAIQAERLRKTVANPESPLSTLRNQIFDTAIKNAELPTGFFSLTVPTGGGKTLASMAFALAHARKHDLRRVIVVIPYLSIIEQNAAEYRRIFGGNVVLENHSGVRSNDDQREEEKSCIELTSENWDASVIVTTSVQFIESLFASSPSRARKLHRIPRSVVIFDEVQTLPVHLLTPTLNVLRELAKNYKTSFVFSSATQPAFRRSSSVPDGFSPNEIREIAPNPDELFQKLRRVTYRFPRENESLDWPTLADALESTPQALCVVNLTRHARELWQELKRRCTDHSVIHLSSAMCPQHRLALIENIRHRLHSGMACRVISTQLIEAGVDVDFPVVWRALGPLDSIVQAAGRCNREGRLNTGIVHVFRPADNKLPQGIYRTATDQTMISLAALGGFESASDSLATGSSVFSDYFNALYSVVNTDHARAGESTIQEDRTYLRYREVSHKAKVIEDSGTPVIISEDNRGGLWGRAIIDEIRNRQHIPGQARFSRNDLRKLQRFMVNTRFNTFRDLQMKGLIKPLLPNLELFVLNAAAYHPALGLILENYQPDDFIS
jgi:CRISPR-associated endonuclease/helicase Cas3